MLYYNPLYSCIKPSGAPVVSEDRVRAGINHVQKYSRSIPIPDCKGARTLVCMEGITPLLDLQILRGRSSEFCPESLSSVHWIGMKLILLTLPLYYTSD